MKTSKFFHQVGPIHHWQNSCAEHKKFTAYLTEELQLLRFDHQTCDWSTHDLAYIDWATQPNEPLEADLEQDEDAIDDERPYGKKNKKQKKEKMGKSGSKPKEKKKEKK